MIGGIVSKQMTQPLRVWKNLKCSSCAHNGDSVEVRLHVLASLKPWIGILVHRVDEGEGHCLSSSFA